MKSKQRHEGYMLIDHRAGDGTSMVPGGTVFEAATITCSHCCRVVVLNPDRSRARGYCPKCDHYVCDQCEAQRVASGGACLTFVQVMDVVNDAGAKGRPISSSLILPLLAGA